MLAYNSAVLADMHVHACEQTAVLPISCVALGSTCLLAGTVLPVFVTVPYLLCCCPGQQRRSSKRLHPLCSRLDLSMQLVEQLACRLLTRLST